AIETEKQFNWKNAFSIFMAGIENYNKKSAVLVVDDWHLVHKDVEIQQFFDRFLACKSQSLHIVILSREKINLQETNRLQVNGKLLEIQGADLMFSQGELYQLIDQVIPNRYSAEDIRKIYDLTEGWIMVIRLFTNSWSSKLHQPASMQEHVEEMDTLFEFMARDVLVRQHPELQTFLLKSSILDSFTVKVCQTVLGSDFKYEYLEAAFKHGLFLSEVGKGTYRYHQLFREFLMQEATNKIADLSLVYSKAGEYYLHWDEPERALQYFILGGEVERAIAVLCKISRDLVHSGRTRLLHQILQQLPEAEACPDIILALGDEARFACQYKTAIRLYEKVARTYQTSSNGRGESAAYLGMGETYLDIIQPLQAEKFLRRAYKALPPENGEEKAAILNLMAENMINQGSPKRAERYSRLARNKIPVDDKNNLEARILLRTGRIQDVISLKEKENPPDQKSYHVPCSFRESSLILSVCYAYAGQATEALSTAQQGIEVGEKLGSPFISAIGYARLGHALLIQEKRDLEQCWSAYRHSLEISSKLDIPRSRTEVLQGTALLYALAGDWCAAERCGREGIAITEKCCDRWFTAILYHTLGMSAALCQRFAEAETYLQKGTQLFQHCGDHFGQAAATWWGAYIALATHQKEIFTSQFGRLLELCRDYNCEFLFKRPSLLGDISNFSSEPFFAEARRLGIESAARPASAATPYKLQIQVLGNLKVWRNGEEITTSSWRRESSRHLFALLLATRHEPLHKEELMDYLWPEADFEAASRNFKVVLSNLMIVLEPHRLPRENSSFIQRKGTIYQFNLSASYSLDADDFESAAHRAMNSVLQNPTEAEQLFQKAIGLYQGDYLDCDWQNELYLAERERLASLFMQAVETLVKLCISQQRYEEALQWADTMLRHDKCWEQAYQLKMLCYGNLQNIPMAVRTYKKCCAILQEELCVQQSDKTTEIYRQLTKTL
ncbi:MAG TPA: BTAD domain-containing putative transcriptional regulator, partial [Negativicutes bacterium]|nr:BTAD domain-containing putative transcriptional regulator [Negativicutes bacterium]